MAERVFSRRQVLAGGVLGGAAAMGLTHSTVVKKSGHVHSHGRETIRRAANVEPAGSGLDAVQHVIFLMHENRSFDHYFGTLKGVAGFDDTNNRSAFTQSWPAEGSTLLPFHMKTKSKQQAECTYDLSHAWTAEHASWDGGTMANFVATHTSNAYEGPLGVVTMGYYEKADLDFYYELADKFTICDNYFCSVLGPTHPNRLMQMTGWVDPAGVAGGPVIVTNDLTAGVQFTCSWTTMPEVLEAKGVSWKVYNPYGANYQPTCPAFISDNVLMYFEQYQDPSSTLYQKAFGYYGPNVTGGLTGGVGPNDFASDVMNNTLPQVSWIIPPDGYDEHPPAPPQLGEWYTQQVLDTLLSNPQVWASTVLFLMYDENDGFFDHVPPVTAPSGTEGEYLTVDPLPSSAGGLAGPIGMGVRVPMIVVSPFSAGGYVCSDVFDHTSQLRFLESVFGVTAPNISAWRRSVTDDLTATLPVIGDPVTKPPKLPVASDSTTSPPISTECTSSQLLEGPSVPTNPIMPPKKQKMPKQERGSLKPTPA
jgi:phospholipase C